MKKAILSTVLGIAGLMTAYSFNSQPAAEGEEGRLMTWTSTCSINHWTTFPDSWNGQQIAQWVSDQNTKECGVRPRNVIVNLSPDMLRIVVEE